MAQPKDPRRFLGDWIDGYLSYTENSEPPRLFHEWCAVSVIASALQRKCWLEWGMQTMYPNLYVVLTAPAGRARKGTAMRPAQEMLATLEVPCAAEAVTRESLIKLLKNAERTIPLEDGPAITHSSLTVFSPELTVFLGYSNLQLMADLTDWFDCAAKWTYYTKSAGVDEVTGVFVNLLGATTPDMLRATLPSDAVGGGLTSRIIFVYAADKEKLVPFPFLSKEDKLLKEKLIADLANMASMKGPFTVTQDFLEAWGDWYVRESGKSPFGLNHTRQLDSYVERRPTQLLKLSIIYSANRSTKRSIEACDFQRGLALLRRTEEKMPNALGGMGNDPNSDLTFRILSQVNQKPALLRELIQAYIYDASAEVITATVDGLRRGGLLFVEHTERGTLVTGINYKGGHKKAEEQS